MNSKKGMKWALSCVATSAAVLSFMIVSSNVNAAENDTTGAVTASQSETPVEKTGEQPAGNVGNVDQPADPSQNNTDEHSSESGSNLNGNEDSSQSDNQKGSTDDQQSAGAQKVATGAPIQSRSAAPVDSNINPQSATRDNNDAVNYGGTFANDIKNYSESDKTGFNLHPEDNELGYAAYFHIFANEAHLSTHTNGNVATGLLDGQVNFGTNIKEELVDYDVSYIQKISKIAGSSFVSGGSNRQNKIVFGNGIAIDVSNPDRPLVTFGDNDEQVYIDHLKAKETFQDKAGQPVYIDFADMFNNYLEPKSQELATREPSTFESGKKALITNSQFEDNNNRVIDLMDMTPDKDNQIVIYLSPDVLQQSTPLTIRGLASLPEGPTVILNVDTQGSNLPLNQSNNQQYTVGSQIKVIYDDGNDRNNHETEYFGDNHLLWNFYDSTASDKLFDGNIDFNNTFQGSVLAPKADVTVHHNLDGNIVADKVNIKGESHRWDLQDNATQEEEEEDKEGEEEEEDKDDKEEGEKPEEEFQTIKPLPIEVEPDLGVDPGEPEEPGEWEGTPDPDPEEPGEEGNWEKPGEPGIPATPWEPDDEDNNGGNTEEPDNPGTETPGKPGIDVEEPGEPDKPVTIPG
ncbi:collagen-binding domain-containing protein [Companilactobacillus hulinensis]|uniref:collagen-binding domain-containing protein n=1 Tax=Companilactobacillus hulinensis TaxID=2486007 RepID=UPI0013DDB16E|nr:collagen-binding domain-containing protein [Companilactobacillus hulinensis]